MGYASLARATSSGTPDLRLCQIRGREDSFGHAIEELFPNDVAKRTAIRDVTTEYELLELFTEWAAEMRTLRGVIDGRAGVLSACKKVLDKQTCHLKAHPCEECGEILQMKEK